MDRALLTKEFVDDREIIVGKKYITNSHWMIREDMISYDNFIQNPKDKGCELLDEFFDSVDQVKVSLKPYRNKFYIHDICKNGINLEAVIPVEEDMFSDWEIFPGIFPLTDSANIMKYVRFHCFSEGKVFIRAIQLQYFLFIDKVLNLEIVPSRADKPCLLMNRDFSEVFGAITHLRFNDEEVDEAFISCRDYGEYVIDKY